MQVLLSPKMGSGDDVAIMCTIALDLDGDGGYINSSDDEGAPPGCWTAAFTSEKDAPVNTIHVRRSVA